MKIPMSASASPQASAPNGAAAFDATEHLRCELVRLLPIPEWAKGMQFTELVALQDWLSRCASDPGALGWVLSWVLGTQVRARHGRLRRIQPPQDRPIGLVGDCLDDAMRLDGALVDGSREVVVRVRLGETDQSRLLSQGWLGIEGRSGHDAIVPGARLQSLAAAILPAGTPVIWLVHDLARQRQTSRLDVSRLDRMLLDEDI
jgi:hypothetical protein